MLAVLFMLALLPRLAYVLWRWPVLPDWNIDAIGYQQLAINVLDRGVFSLNTEAPFLPDAVRTPGYPIAIAAIFAVFGREPRWVLLAQVLVDSLTAVGVALLAGRLASSSRTQPAQAALWAGACYAFNPLCWRYCAELYVESLLAGVLTLVFVLLAPVERLSARRVIGLAVVSAVAILLKPALTVLPIILLAVWVWRQQLRQALVFGVVCLLVIAPWLVRNGHTFGRPMVSQVFENNLVTVSGPATLAEANGEPVVPWSPNWQGHFFEIVTRASQMAPDLMNIPERQMTDPQRDQAQQLLAATAREMIAQHRLAFVRSHLRGVVLALVPREHQFWFAAITGKAWEAAVPGGLWAAAWQGDWQSVSRLARVLWVLGWVISGIGVVLAVRGGWQAWSIHRSWAIAAVGLGLYLLVLPGPIAYERFYVPLVPLYCVMMGVGLTQMANAIVH